MTELTPEQKDREHHLSRIRAYAIQHGLSGKDIALIFEAGLMVARVLRPDIFGPAPKEGEGGNG